MANNNRISKGEASVGKLVVDDLIRFSDATEQTTAYHQYNLNAYSTATQTNTGGGTAPVAMRFETTSAANQITIVNNTRITPNHSSDYNIQFSAQVDKTDGGSDDIDIWFAINGTAVPYSNTRITLPSNAVDKVVASWNFITPLASTEYAEIYWYSADVNLRLYAEGPQTNPTRPGIPSVILTVWEI